MGYFSTAYNIQKEISKKLIPFDTHAKIENVCGIDVSYKNNVAFTSAVISNTKFEFVASINLKFKVEYPYIPGLLFLRESGPLLNTLLSLKNKFDFDILLIDGHGILHPRKCGLASYIGYMIDKPTIGVAKSLLCGSVKEDHFIEYEGSVLGYEIKNEGRKPIYVSIGHKISLENSIQIVKKLTKETERLPEPLRVADINSKNYSNFVD